MHAVAACADLSKGLVKEITIGSLGDQDPRSLGKALQDNTSLTTLKIRFCAISLSCSKALAVALLHNRTLTALHFTENTIRDGGTQALAEALQHNDTLTSLSIVVGMLC